MDIKEEMLLHKWAKDLADQSSSGLTQEQWCKLNGVNINTFRYRNRRVCNAVELKHQENSKEIVPFENKMPEPTFAKVTLKAPENPSTGIQITLQGIQSHISSDTTPEQIRTVLEVLANVERSQF